MTRGGEEVEEAEDRASGFCRRIVFGGNYHQFTPTARQLSGVDYRLAYVAADGTVLVLYDNQAGHPPHRHVGGVRLPYRFTDVDHLVDDFLADVARLRGE